MLKRLRAYIIDFFAIGHNEAKGVILLILLTLLFLISPWLYRWLRPDVISHTDAADQRKLDSLVALMRVDGERDEQERFGNRHNYNSGGSGSRGQDQHLSEQYHEAKPFPFDPNTVSVAGWQQLGLPRWLAERIDKYRTKGGQFRRKEDLLRIYDFPPEAYEQLEPYIQLATAGKPTANDYTPRSTDRTEETGATQPAGTAPTRERFVKYPIQPFDINTADTTQLIALKGIGSKMASRIISHRDGLGGFVSSEQFKDIYGMDSINLAELTLYGQIKSQVRKIPVNTASAADLDRFPFLSRRQAEVIVNYRTQHGAFTSIESLKAVRVLDTKTINKLTPYLAFQP
ncbi:helix-hairpin-helix domain-containing protein [Fibrella sp. HMF5335]|uniref:Helix-hairpin-helix domain-containing protein n=1 Tax=Fibrella rubiginis TaxID=2817060 RepID=A0A939GEK1_9BACT|nr:helix-hairpin-helix domain-containing protein [Fibrella rubiginis]MBO0936901.1 helix-hairpin-helix domain-containing protein [Fibrella rubiginis]